MNNIEGLFIKQLYGHDVCVKTSKKSYDTIDGVFKVKDKINKREVNMTGVQYLLWQLNQRRPLMEPQIESLDDLDIPVIDFKVFNDYDSREETISVAKKVQKDFDKAKYKIFGSTRLIRVDSKGLSNSHEYYLVKDGKYTPAEDLIDAKELEKKATVFNMPLYVLQKYLRDDLVNNYTEAYNAAVKAWEDI